MKSRMDKYYKEEELMQRTSKNDFLYDELYKEKQMPNSNVTVLDNINEIDINKIKALVDSREGYKKLKDYNTLLNNGDERKLDEVKYDFEEKDSSEYDINEILKRKRADNLYDDSSKVRRISNKEYEIMASLEEEEDGGVDLLTHEQQLKDLFNTVSKVSDDDLFANLKDDKKEEEKFYTNTSKIENLDFEDDGESKNNSKPLIIIVCLVLLIAILAVIYIKFIK